MEASRKRLIRPSKLAVLSWYLRRPVFYGSLFGLLKTKLTKALGLVEDTRAQARNWCESCAVETSTALKALTGNSWPEPLESMFPQDFDFAAKMASSCPVTMGGSANQRLIYHVCEFLAARKVVETGVAYGWSSLSILLSLQNRSDAHLISTDMPYPGRDNDRYVGCVVPDNLRARW